MGTLLVFARENDVLCADVDVEPEFCRADEVDKCRMERARNGDVAIGRSNLPLLPAATAGLAKAIV